MIRNRSLGRSARATGAALGLAASVLVTGGALTSAQPPSPEDVLSHFLCYEGEFATFAGTTVTLNSTLGTLTVGVRQPRLFCNPVRKTRGDVVTKIVSIHQHLTGYIIRPDPPVTGTGVVAAANQFGDPQTFTVDRAPTRLLVPTRKRPHDFPSKLDHFVCHRIVDGKSIDTRVRLRDQFTEFGTRVLRPALFCPPTAKRHGDKVFEVRNPQAYLVCYTIEPRRLDPPQTRGTKNQFQTAPVTAKVANRLCVPSSPRTVI